MQKKTIWVFCPWLQIGTPIGSFFIEQAELVTQNYDIALFTFSHNRIAPFHFFKVKGLVRIRQLKSSSKIKIYNVRVLQFIQTRSHFLNVLFNKLNANFRDRAIKKLLIFGELQIGLPDLVHSQSLLMDGIYAYKLFLIKNIPYIISEHNQLSFLNSGLFIQRMAVNAFERAHLRIAISRDKIRQFAANGLYGDFIFLGNLISKKFFYRIRVSEDQVLKIVTIGNFSVIKDHQTLFKALKLVDGKTMKKIKFKWIGLNGWGQDRTKDADDLIKSFSFENIEIKMYSILDRESVAKILQNSDLFVFSSISEGMPVSVLEALASGCPVFSSNCGGVDDVINDTNGRIYPIMDYYALSDLIFKYDQGLIQFDNAEISRQILSRFGEEPFRNRLIEIYEKALIP